MKKGRATKKGKKGGGAQRLLHKAALRFHRFLRKTHPAKIAVLGYLSYVIAGWIFLSLPISHRAGHVAAIDNLFISASAVSTTGLVTVSVSGSYSFFGQLVILLLMQLGGIGYMTIGSFVILSRKASLPHVREEVAKTVFSLPHTFRIDKFIRSVITFTLVIEAMGAAALYSVFSSAGAADPLWSAVFHSVSAFCTAGFSLYDSNFEAFAANFWLNAVIGSLCYMGAIGFIVWVDFWRMAMGKISEITLTSKIILWATVWLAVTGITLIFLAEPSVRGMPAEERLMASFFLTMASMTTVGFNTVSVGGLSKATLLVVIMLMIIGSSPSGTGGGLKSTTFTAILGVMKSALHGEQEVRFWGRPVPPERVWTAVASLGFYVAALVTGTYLLELTQKFPFDQNLFEAASALGTVGLSAGITASLTGMGKIIVMLLMICGRLGPLTFGMALFFSAVPPEEEEEPEEDLAV